MTPDREAVIEAAWQLFVERSSKMSDAEYLNPIPPYKQGETE